MKMGDRVRFASDADVINSLRELGLQLRSAGSTVPVRDKGDYLGFVLGHLVAYASGQLIRLASLYQIPSWNGNAGVDREEPDSPTILGARLLPKSIAMTKAHEHKRHGKSRVSRQVV
jgi:hypothetical protein